MRRVLAATLLAACSGVDPEPPVAREELTLEVLHLGLALPGTFPEQRLEGLGDALRESPADVLCVQGIWRPADRGSLVAALSATFPFSLELPTGDSTAVDDPTAANGTVPEPELEPSCGSEDEVRLGSLLICLRSFCSYLQNDAEVMLDDRCLEGDRCGELVDELVDEADPGQRCRACALTHLKGGSSFDETFDRCRNHLGNPLAHDGQHGMMMLSRLPLTRPAIHVLPGESVRRAALSATIELGSGPLDVHCASLGPGDVGLPGDPSTSEPYPGPYGNPQVGWGAEHALQVEKLIAHVLERSGDRRAVVLGNFGASEGASQDGELVLSASAPQAVTRLLGVFDEAVAPGTPPACTLCSQNRMLPHDSAPSWLNRIYLSGLPGAEARASSRTYLGDVVEIPPGGVITRVPLSLQYGFRATLSLESP